MTTTTTKPDTKLDDEVLDQWPPVAHLIRKEDEPAKPGTVALCGKKLMGIDLGPIDLPQRNVCPKCVKIAIEEMGG